MSCYNDDEDNNKKCECENMPNEKLLLVLETIHHNKKVNKLLKLGYYPYIYNSCYGGGREMSLTGNYLFKKYKEYYPEVDSNIIKARLIEYLQDKIISRYSSICFFCVKEDYKDFVSNNEYDGLEIPFFNYDKYYLIKSKEIVDNVLLTSDEKITKLKELIDLDISTITIEYDEIDNFLEENSKENEY